MSSVVLQFTPRLESDSKQNLNEFIDLCRKSEVLGACNQFNLNTWEIGHLKGHNKVQRVIFSTLDISGSENQNYMSPPFLDFAKAMLIYWQCRRPAVSLSVRVVALRCMEAALRERNAESDPTAVTSEILDAAVALARSRSSPSTAYILAGQIEMIAKLMVSKGFISLRHQWTHGVKKPANAGSRISKEAIAARQEKLPSSAALHALAGIFHRAKTAPDVVIASYLALMICAPERINEVLRLRRNCLVEGEGDFAGKLGLRWAGSKGFGDATKWLPSEMAPIARQAVAKLLKVTEPAQKIAAWYTSNPGKLYLHDNAKHLRDKELLTLEDISLLLWGTVTATAPANYWAQITNGLSKVSRGKRLIGFYFKDVERAVIALLPKTFPFVPGAPGLLCKDAVAIVNTQMLHAKNADFLCMFSCVDYAAISSRLGHRNDMPSIFSRFGYTEDDGSPIVLKSHSLRHYLNMLAQLGGLSSVEIAIFSGRKDVRQNRAYDHMSSDEIQAPISEALRSGFTSNLVSTERRDLKTRNDFRLAGMVAAHTTEFGWCMHNFASAPCQMYRDCINCEEQECVKGDAHKEDNLRKLKIETEYLLSEARVALGEMEYGADSWVKHQTMTLERINTLLSILESPTVSLGARIRLDLANAPLITAVKEKTISVPVASAKRRRP